MKTLMLKFLACLCFFFSFHICNAQLVLREVMDGDNGKDMRNSKGQTLHKARYFIYFTPALVSTSIDQNNSLTPPRYTAFLQGGVTFNKPIYKSMGYYYGFTLNNMGFIDKNTPGTTVKRRVYALGATAGFNVFTAPNSNFRVNIGAGADLPFNYKEKTFVPHEDKEVHSEWFSHQTVGIMPYFSAGIGGRFCNLKVQYYPGNFMNTGYTTRQGTNYITPYSNYSNQMVMLVYQCDLSTIAFLFLAPALLAYGPTGH